MVPRVSLCLLGLVFLLLTSIISLGMAGGPPDCGYPPSPPVSYQCAPPPCAPVSYQCAPQPCAPQSCGSVLPFQMPGPGGILSICTSLCGACIGIPAACMSAILAPPRCPPQRPRQQMWCPPPSCAPAYAPQACPPPACAPPTCAPMPCQPPERITKCKPTAYQPCYAPASAAPPIRVAPPQPVTYGPPMPQPLLAPARACPYCGPSASQAYPGNPNPDGGLFGLPLRILSGVMNLPSGGLASPFAETW